MSTKAEDQAFPGPYTKGMTKREYFAAMALQGLLSSDMSPFYTPGMAVEIADKLIEELNKEKETK